LLLDTFAARFPRHRPMAMTLARTGMRLGEVIALQWGDIDFHNRFINVQRSLSLDTVQRPKSGKTRRVDMSKQLAEAAWRRHR
jgi:integrase